jgi:hypothetical protein
MGPKGEKGERGDLGLKGERGETGAPGKLAQVKIWHQDQINYEGDLVSHQGSTWQALKDTAKAPNEKSDWALIAKAGQAAKEFRARGTYKITGEDYVRLDIVTKDSSSFVALKDNPGPCPGEGWQLLACGGKRGASGEKGAQGERGLKGEPGIPGKDGTRFVKWKVDTKNYKAVAVLSDGSEHGLELRGLFEQFHLEMR